MVESERTINGRTGATHFIIIAAQSVKNTDSTTEKGYDAEKKVSRIKRHMAVDTHGLPHALSVTTAAVGDRKVLRAGAERPRASAGDVRHVRANH